MAFLLFVLCIFACVAAATAVVRLSQGRALLPRPTNRIRRKIEFTGLVRSILIAAGVGVGVVAIVPTMPVYGLIAGAAVFLWPRFMQGGAKERDSVAKIEALAVWTESLRDTATTQAALETAIPATVADAPKLLTQPLRELSQNLARMEPLPIALTRFADAVDDRGADLVVAALSLNARTRSGSLRRVLSTLAANTRSELDQRRRVLKERNALRRQAQQVIGLIVLLAAGQALFEPAWVAPYATPAGEFALLVLAIAFVGLLVRMQRLAAPEPQPRFLQSAEKVTEIAEWRSRTTGLFAGGGAQ